MSVKYGSNVKLENVSWSSSASMTLTSTHPNFTDMFKTSGVNGSWDAQVYSLQGFTAPCTIMFNKFAATTDNGYSYAMIGWNEDPTTDASYSSIDHASYPYATIQYVVYNNGTPIGSLPAWDTAKKFYVVYGTDGLIKHYNGSTLLYTSASYGTGKTVYVDSSYYISGTQFYPYNGFTNVAVVKRAWNGTYFDR